MYTFFVGEIGERRMRPKPVQERNGGVEGRFTYTEAGFNDYFNFPSSLRVNLIELQSGYAILALPNA